jgi:hypothetical protein
VRSTDAPDDRDTRCKHADDEAARAEAGCVTRTPFQRAREMLAEHDMRGRTEPLRWRISSDVHDALLPAVHIEDGAVIARALSTTFMGCETTYGDRLFGLPVIREPSLPPNSMILEAA